MNANITFRMAARHGQTSSRRAKALLDLAEGLPEVAARKEIRHSIFGPIELDEIIRIAGRHDSLHVQQIRDQIRAKSG